MATGKNPNILTTPKVIVSDNGTKLTSAAVLQWAGGRLNWHYIEPGKPVQNAFIESSNSSPVLVFSGTFPPGKRHCG